MNRKLHTRFNALLVAAAVAAVGVSATAASPFEATRTAASAAPEAAVEEPSVADKLMHRHRQLTRMRHSLAMPYFSFVPRG